MNIPQHSMSEVDLRLNSIRLDTIGESAKFSDQKLISPTNFVLQLPSSTHLRELQGYVSTYSNQPPHLSI
jgi:hypothetical protein